MYVLQLMSMYGIAQLCYKEKNIEELAKHAQKMEIYSSHEELMAFNMCVNKEVIKEYNKRTNYSFLLGENNNIDLSYSQILTKYTALGMRNFTSFKDGRVIPEMNEIRGDELILDDGIPDAYDVREYLFDPIDQGNCGSCYAHAAYNLLSAYYNMKIMKKRHVQFSVQHYLDCGLNERYPNCNGGSANMPLDFARRFGLVNESDYAYIGYVRNCNKNLRTMKADFLQNLFYIDRPTKEIVKNIFKKYGPIILPLASTDYELQFYKSGIIDRPCTVNQTNHYVVMVGYNKTADGREYYIARNSMGPSWGENGYFKILAGKNLCGIEDHLIGLNSSPALTVSRLLLCLLILIIFYR